MGDPRDIRRSARNAILNEPPPPFAYGVLMDIEAFGDFLALKPLGAQQDHSTSIRKRMRRLVAADLTFEKGPVRIVPTGLSND